MILNLQGSMMVNFHNLAYSKVPELKDFNKRNLFNYMSKGFQSVRVFYQVGSPCCPIILHKQLMKGHLIHLLHCIPSRIFGCSPTLPWSPTTTSLTTLKRRSHNLDLVSGHSEVNHVSLKQQQFYQPTTTSTDHLLGAWSLVFCVTCYLLMLIILHF